VEEALGSGDHLLRVEATGAATRARINCSNSYKMP
jgi:hypothetical protein